jgi:hypothetical protein
LRERRCSGAWWRRERLGSCPGCCESCKRGRGGKRELWGCYWSAVTVSVNNSTFHSKLKHNSNNNTNTNPSSNNLPHPKSTSNLPNLNTVSSSNPTGNFFHLEPCNCKHSQERWGARKTLEADLTEAVREAAVVNVEK